MHLPRVGRPGKFLVLALIVGVIVSFELTIVVAPGVSLPGNLHASAAVAGLQSASSSSVLLSDDFTQDSSLNTGLWVVNGPQATASMSVFGYYPLVSVPPIILLSSKNGLTMSGVSSDYTFADVQAVSTFFPPFTVQARVMASVSNGNPIVLVIATATGAQGISITGNLNVSNPYYGMGSAVSHGNGTAWLELGDLVRYPQLGTWYSLTIAVNASGVATAMVDQGATQLGSIPYYIGPGVYYLFLGQVVDQPPAIGPNSASWSYIYVNETTYASSVPFFTTGSATALGVGLAGVVLGIVGIALALRRKGAPPPPPPGVSASAPVYGR